MTKKKGGKVENIHFKKLALTTQPPHTQKAKGVWKLIRENKFSMFTVPKDVFLAVHVQHNNVEHTVTDERAAKGYTWPYSEECEACKTGKPVWPWGLSNGSKQPLRFEGKLFARPCPARPRHGFEESVPIMTLEDAQRVFERARKADAEAELIVMPMINAKYSAIYVPESGALILGSGHDGATGGRDSITLPVCEMSLDKDWRDPAGIASHEHAYIELVMPPDDYKPVIVQARSGPPIPVGAKEYIPAPMQVTDIITPTDDLLAWEELCLSLAGREGLVGQQVGGSMGAHAAIHCRANGIAYVTREVHVGEWIYPPEVKPYPFDVAEFHAGVRYAETYRDIKQGLKVAIAITHNILRLEYAPEYSRLLGYATGFLFRAAALACLGESRHYRSSQGTGKAGALGTTSREGVYEKAKGMESHNLCTLLAKFSYKFMRNTWAGGYGGYKWYAALVQSCKLWNYISAARHQEALATANTILNLAHNGGWLLNKFCDQSIMTEAQEKPGATLAKYMGAVMDIIKADVDASLIKVRSYRASKKWEIGLEPSTAHKLNKNAFTLRVNGIIWHSLVLNSEAKKTLKDTFDHV